jgi:hypothetical protein
MNIQKRPLPSDKLDTEMKKAIDADKADYFKFIRKRDEGTQTNPRTVLVRFMDDPDRKPAEINGMSSSTVLAIRLTNMTLVQRKYSGYAEIRWELINESLVERVDLWIRHNNDQEQASTPNWHYWEYANPKCSIIDDKETLEIDVVDIQKRVEYIVAAVREESDREVPVPLGESLRIRVVPASNQLTYLEDIGRGGGNCCQEECGTLRFHLKNLWPSHIVTEATLLSDPSNKDVWSKTLSDEYFEHRTNNLYLRRKRKGSSQLQ